VIPAPALLAALPLLLGRAGELPSGALACAALGGLLLLRLREQWQTGEAGPGALAAVWSRAPRLLPLLEHASFALAAAALLYRLPAAPEAAAAGVPALLAATAAALAAARTLPAPPRVAVAALAPLVFAGCAGLAPALLLLALGCAFASALLPRAAFAALAACFAAAALFALSAGPQRAPQAVLLAALGLLLARRWPLRSRRFLAALAMAAAVCAAAAGAGAQEPAAWGGLLAVSPAGLAAVLAGGAVAGVTVRARCGTLQGKMLAELFLSLLALTAAGLLAGGPAGVTLDLAFVAAAGYAARWWAGVLG